ncbi:flagellar biosynthetic protein FliR [Pseudoxanthobacter soli DSM 19599]|uniref:Flagellar biosynthetic protein FliR n=1 Tax=Pseudoxanthobacter soli DSM 19599 TaxID=1123029 RepID=A0A1M7ZEA2_9HYPH|nr:flagellar biosynthetic protein FliR [Pseudoxanthobacter soli]SHO63203.1 flagellar biosynthetic protein FliR [Pseudoxanthobacter soli DSM 19599]
MNEITSTGVLSAFVVFCRVGGCLMIMPGFSYGLIPVRVRLFVAFAVVLALLGVVPVDRIATLETVDVGELLRLIAVETLVGVFIGLMGRMFFMMLQTILVAMVTAIGLGGLPGTMPDDTEMLPALATLISLAALTMLFVTDMHWELLKGIADSYRAIPLGIGLSPAVALASITDQMTDTFLLVLRIGSPFIVYSIIVNFAVGLANKLVPQIPVYFITTPFVIAGGLMLLYLTIDEFLLNFIDGFSRWAFGG